MLELGAFLLGLILTFAGGFLGLRKIQKNRKLNDLSEQAAQLGRDPSQADVGRDQLAQHIAETDANAGSGGLAAAWERAKRRE